MPADLAQLPALTVRQPWATSIVLLGKPVENRSWPAWMLNANVVSLRKQSPDGRFLIHAAKDYSPEEFAAWREFVEERIPEPVRATWPAIDPFGFPTGGIIGVARYSAWRTSHPSPWFTGPGAIEVVDVRPVAFVPCRGALGFFRPKISAALDRSQPQLDLFPAQTPRAPAP